MRRNASGFTLIELMVAIAIAAILALMAMPLYSQFIANTQVRSATESLANGMRAAQTEAIKRNGQVEFRLVPNVGWEMYFVEDPALALQSMNVIDTSPKVTFGAGGLTRVTFNGLGRIVNPNPLDGTAPISVVDITSTMANVDKADVRELRIEVSGSSGIKACDPKLDATDPAGCRN